MLFHYYTEILLLCCFIFREEKVVKIFVNQPSTLQPTNSMPKKIKDSAWEVFSKATTRSGEWDKTTFPRLSDALFWLRFIIAIVIGTSWAILDMRGQAGIVGYAVASSVLVFFYYSVYLKVDVEDYGQFNLISEGFMPSFGLFLLVWSIFHNVIRVSDEDINLYN